MLVSQRTIKIMTDNNDISACDCRKALRFLFISEFVCQSYTFDTTIYQELIINLKKKESYIIMFNLICFCSFSY